ncbi:uncharacterized protein LOC106643472 [Copidosoma floridanum]|uniref:uncharacterized protein LOC106643472 n=1 Tax=Copidosoma floridanum TaxID=29053 RepID=UPI000C6FC7A4|nr:uncharacterized protein LOC106643472 [Copidosoma floridanum]
MAFFQLMLKANKLQRVRRTYHDEKLRSIEVSKGEKPRYTLGQKIRHQRVLLRRNVRRVVRKLACCPESSWVYQKAVLLRTEGTVENYVFKSIFGFLGGVVLTYVFFVFFVFQLHLSLTIATLLCSLLGLLFTIGLAFFPYVRCIILLFLPQFFSKRGRQALMAYAFILTLAGPARNTLHNLGALSESLACVQEQLKDAVRSVIELVKHPFYALRQSLVQIVRSIKAVARKIRRMLVATKRLVMSILQVIESAFEWLASVVSLCNKEFGTPYERCQAMFQRALEDCRWRLGDNFGKMCVVTGAARVVCLPLKPLDVICGLVSYVSDAIVAEVKQKLRAFSRGMRAMFFVRIRFKHEYHMETNKSRNLGEISAEISSEIKSRTRRFLGIFGWAGLLACFFFFFLVLRVIHYRYKWLTSDRFDNHYLTGHMRDIDLRRARQDKETLFPLNWRERAKYIKPTSILLARSERTRLAKSAVFLALACVKLAVYLAIDYCLFWTLDTIRYHGKMSLLRPRERQRQAFAASSVQVKGTGFLAELFRGIAGAFSPYGRANTQVEDSACLPEPRPPDYDGYARIATVALLCWVMAFFEPYGLRLRHAVLSQYYPDRAKQRAVWLYNRILRSRGSFLKFARRQLRRKLGTAFHADVVGIEQVTLRERLRAVFPFLDKLLGPPRSGGRACVLCGQPERSSLAPHVACPTPGCAGLYCPQCFQDLGKLCTVCLSPLDYGDLTDISEEKDSSEEELDMSHLKKKMEALRAKAKEGKVEGEKEITKEEAKKKDEPVADGSDDESSKYSYSYQDESADESVSLPYRSPFRDVEAQQIRDDVTMQIFSEPSCEEESSNGRVRMFCFGLGRKRKRKKRSVQGEDEKSDSTSVADTESWTTEEVEDEEEEGVLEIEIEDFDEQKHSDDELLPKTCGKKRRHKKRNKLMHLFSSLGKVFSFKKVKQKKAKSFWYKNRKDSINACYDTEHSSSSILSNTCDENLDLLPLQRIEKRDKSTLRKRNSGGAYRYPHEVKFEIKELPKHLQSVCEEVKYFEVDESSNSWYSPREKIRCQVDNSTLTDSGSSVDSDSSRERLSSSSNADNDSYIYTSDNNEKCYETHSSSSDTFLPSEVLELSENSSDFLEDKKTVWFDNDKVSNKLGEDKIDEDSNEKGTQCSKKIIDRRKKFHNSWRNREKIKTDRNERDSKTSRDCKILRDKTDDLKKDKVEKETANAKKKMSSDYDNDSIVEKIDKSIGVQEADIEKSLRGADEKTFTIRRVSELFHMPAHPSTKVIDTIISQRYVWPLMHRDIKAWCKSCIDCQISKVSRHVTNNPAQFIASEDHPATRDQGTYVRLKTLKFKRVETNSK